MYSHMLSHRHTAAVQQWILGLLVLFGAGLAVGVCECTEGFAAEVPKRQGSDTIMRLNPNILPRRARSPPRLSSRKEVDFVR